MNFNFVAKWTLVVTMVLLVASAGLSVWSRQSGLGTETTQFNENEDIPLDGAQATYLAHYADPADNLDIYVFHYNVPNDTSQAQDEDNAFAVLMFLWKKAQANWKNGIPSADHVDVLLWLNDDSAGTKAYHLISAVDSGQLKTMLDTNPQTFNDLNPGPTRYINIRLS